MSTINNIDETELKWVKYRNIENISFVSKTTIIMGYGSSLKFINLNNGNEKYLKVNVSNKINNNNIGGTSIKCFVGQPILEIFAYADMCLRPKIYLLTYPDLRLITTLFSNTSSQYVNMDFSETEHLIALKCLPNYGVEIWNWRSEKLLVNQFTNIISDDQYIRFCRSYPFTATQIAYKLGLINCWDIHIAIDSANLIKRSLKLPCDINLSPFHFTYGIDGSIFLINRKATVWQIYPTSNKFNEIICWIEKSAETTEEYDSNICFYKSGLIITGPDGGVIKFFKKSESDWNEMWSIELEFPIIKLECFNQEYLIGISKDNILYKLIDELDNTTQQIIPVKEYERFFKYLCMINPIGEYIFTVNTFDLMHVFKIETGEKISTFNKISKICSIQSHPLLPVIAVGNTIGILYLLSIYTPLIVNILTEFYLCENEIKFIRFNRNGNILVVNNCNGDFFIIKGEIGKKMEIIEYIKNQETPPIIDFIICETLANDTLYIFGLINQQMDVNNFSIIVLIQFKLNDINSTEKLIIQLPNNYRSIFWLTANALLKTNTIDLLIIPNLSKTIDTFVFDVLTSKMVIKNSLNLHHLNENFNVSIAANNTIILLWDNNGLISGWDKNHMKPLFNFIAHNKFTLGIEHAVCDPFTRYIITLGKSGNLQCNNLIKNEFDDNKNLQLIQSIKNNSVKDMFKNQTIGFICEENKDKRWTQIQIENECEQQRLLYKNEKEMLLKQLQELKIKLKLLIDENEKVPDNKKLPIQAFNLDTDWSDRINETARKTRELEKIAMETYCKKQNENNQLIKSNTWDLMKIKSIKLIGIYTDLNVENYPLLRRKKFKTIDTNDHDGDDDDDELKKIILWRSSELLVSKNDLFLPWIPNSTNVLDTMAIKSPGYMENEGGVNSISTMLSITSTNSADDISVQRNSHNKKLENYSLSGTSSHLYIKPFPLRYNQLDVVTYQQMAAENIMGQHDILALRKYFNNIFDNMKSTKDHEMNLVKQRNNRLRIIQNELNLLEKLKGSKIIHNEIIQDPEYLFDEQPEKIIQVKDWEVPITPYISPSQQLILDEEAAERERKRLEMLADDFRERALIQMMDGVLEIRWEDEIKKNPLQPNCIVAGKDPKDYDKDDLFEIQEYDDKMKFLYAEREKYHLMLLNEKEKIAKSLDDQISKFNAKIGDTLIMKMRIESAICQEELKLLRNSLYNFERAQFTEKENELHKEMNELRLDIENTARTFNNLEEKFLNCKTKYEELTTKDRLLDKQFKTTFSEYTTPAIVDQAYRIFRRRPKWHMRAWQTSAILLNMAKRINTGDTSINGPPLPEECFTYLQLVEHVDKFSNAPNLMDQSIWQLLCKMRRVKIEIEFKLRSCGVQLAEAEASVNAYLKEINAKKAKMLQLEKKMDELKEQRAAALINRTVQIVLQRGQIEIPLTGRLSDFDSSVLLHVSDVNDINAVIKKAGIKKLKTMENAAVFRRKIIYTEWEHKVLKMKIEDMKEFISVIEKSKITKEVQAWLKQKQQGHTEDLSNNALNREIDAMVSTTEAGLRKIEDKIANTDRLIAEKTNENRILDKKIQNLNIDVTAKNLARDITMEEKNIVQRNERMSMLRERSRLLRQVQQQHAKILELSTLLELQRLKTYPTLNFSSNPYRKY